MKIKTEMGGIHLLEKQLYHSRIF